MQTSFTVILLFLGLLISFLGVLRIIYPTNMRSTVSYLFIGISLIGVGLTVFARSTEEGLTWTSVGMIFLVIAACITILGIWYSIWGPASERNAQLGGRILGWGVVLLAISLVIISLDRASFFQEFNIPRSGNNQMSLVFWEIQHLRQVQLHFLPMSFLTFSFLVVALGNTIFVVQNVGLRRMIGGNLLFLVLLYLYYLYLR